MDETSDEDESPSVRQSTSCRGSRGLAGVSSALEASALGLDPRPGTTSSQEQDETNDMSVSTLHLYDIHLSQVSTFFFLILSHILQATTAL